jgi:hypothetical protein
VTGYGGDARRHAATIGLPPGSVLCFYTDGLAGHPGELTGHDLAGCAR